MIRKVYRYTFLLIVLLLVVGCNKNISGGGSKELEKYYLASESNKVVLLDENYEKEKEVIRGEVVELIKKDEEYYKVKYDGEEYYINKKNLSKDEENIILEKELFVRTSLNFYKDKDTSSLIGLIKKGSKLEILGYDKIIVVTTQPKEYIKKKYKMLPFKIAYKKYPNFINTLKKRHIKYNETTKYIINEENKGNIFVIRPTRKVKIKKIEKDPNIIKEQYYLGFNDMENSLEALKKYLKNRG